LKSRDCKFWSKVRARIEANEDAARIKPFAVRVRHEAAAQKAAVGLSAADHERARLDYLEWIKDRFQQEYGARFEAALGCPPRSDARDWNHGPRHAAYFRAALAEAERKAYARRRARFPYVPEKYDRDTVKGRAAIPTPWDELGGQASWHEADGFELGGDYGGDPGGVIVQGAPSIAREEWDGMEVEEYDMPYVSAADQALLARILAKSPGRKRGRPPVNGKAMTDAERQRRHRAREDA
jgi:hypothetical protein